jgi:hypothetical protein
MRTTATLTTSFLLAMISPGCAGPVSSPADASLPDDAARSPGEGDAASPSDAATASDAASLDAGPPPADWLVSGTSTSCASRAGRVYCWGSSWTGTSMPTPTEIPELAGVRSVSVGRSHACALMGNGRVACAGENRGGQLGVSPREVERRDTFAIVEGVPAAVVVATGGSTSCAISDDGAVWCWGDDSLGQTGSPIPRHSAGSNAPQPTPARVEGIDDATALLADGHTRCWGYDWFGALGRGAGYTGAAQHVPADVEGIDDAIALAFDGNGGCVARGDGAVACWGGQVHLYPGYDPATDDECSVVVAQVCWRAPRPLALPAAHALALGGGAGCIETGAGWQCFGRGAGDAISADGLAPGATLTLGAGHLCAMDASGTITCRGRGEEGQLGDGRATSSTDWVTAVLP